MLCCVVLCCVVLCCCAVLCCGVVQATLTLILLRVIDQRDAYQGFSDPGERQLSTCKQKLPPFLLVCFYFCLCVFLRFFLFLNLCIKRSRLS